MLDRSRRFLFEVKSSHEIDDLLTPRVERVGVAAVVVVHGWRSSVVSTRETSSG